MTDYMMVREGDDGAGATVLWRLRGEFPRAKLVEAVQGHWFKIPLPPVREPEVALRRAVAGLRGKRRLVRPVRKGLWAIIDEGIAADGNSLKHWSGPTVSLDAIGRLVVKNGMGSVMTAADDERVEELLKAYDHFLDALTPDDVSAWLIENAQRLGAVTMRDGGGLYYLPPGAMQEWRAIVDVLDRVSSGRHVVSMIPTVRMTRDGAKAILASLTIELEVEVERLRAELISGDLGVRALENRAALTATMLGKVEQYEALLATPMAGVRDMVNNLSTDLVAAKLAAEADEVAS
jgi:hypothetical protein